MIQSITIDNFRGIKHLEINDFRKVNLLVGKNNCGKTTVLESLMVASYPTNPTLVFGLNNQRLIDITEWRYVFYGGKDNEITLKMKDAADTEHCLHISRHEEVASRLNAPSINPDDIYKKGVKFSYRQNGGEEYVSFFFPNEDEPPIIRKKYRTLFNTVYLPAGLPYPFEMLNEMFIQKREQKLIQVLQEIEPKLTQILPIDNRFYVDIDDMRLPLNVMGDGFLKVLVITLSVARAKDGIALVDEIENGFHYSSLEVLWKAVFAAAREFNVQVFATTHSWECIGAFSEAEGLDEDDIRLFRIDKFDDGHYVTNYTGDIIQTAMEARIEVR
jgi:AAA15 family ATPase/GTPase